MYIIHMCVRAYVQIYTCTHLYTHTPAYEEIKEDLGEEIRCRGSIDFLTWKIKAAQTQQRPALKAEH